MQHKRRILKKDEMMSSRKPIWILIIAVIATMTWGVGVIAQEVPEVPSPGDEISDQPSNEKSVAEPEDAVEPAEVSPEVPPELSTPRMCYQTYIDAMHRATEGEMGALEEARECFDLSEISQFIRKERGNEIAIYLGKILDYSPEINPQSLPNTSTAPPATLLTHSEGNITMARGEDGAWRFTSSTVAAIPEIFRGMELSGAFEAVEMTGEQREDLSGGLVAQELGFRSWIPASWKNRTFLLEDWQWVYLLLIVLIGLVIDRVIPILVAHSLRFWLRNTILKDRRELMFNTARPFGFLVMAAFWWFMLGRSGLEEGVLVVLLTAAKFMTAAGIVWCAYRAADIFSELVEHAAGRTESRMDDLLAPFVRKTLKVFVTVFGVVFIASNVDIDVTSLLAGLGIGGVAIALAAKDTVENLFGSITVLFDHPFQVGDWVVIGDVEGTVEELGFRSTRIRTFYNSLVTVPNAKLINANVDNMGARTYRRISTMISITYDTPPEKIEAFCEGIRELIRTHPYTRKDYFHVWLNQFSSSSLDVLLYCFLITPEWATELRERHRLFLDIIRLANDLGIEFAFPTQTIHMAEDQPSPPVFPETGSIKSVVDSGMDRAGKRAVEITHSELGGKSVVPEPVDFGGPGSTEGVEGDEE